MDTLTRKWSFRMMVILLPMAAACFAAEAMMAVEWAHKQQPVRFMVDMVPAFSALLVGAAFVYVLPARAACEGRKPDRTTWLYLAAATVLGLWAGCCVGQLANLHSAAHATKDIGEMFSKVSCYLAFGLNTLADVAIVREILLRAPVKPDQSC